MKRITEKLREIFRPNLSTLFLPFTDLMDFRNCQCNCSRELKWAMNITDHHTKYVYTAPLKDKTADETLQVFQRYCFTYGFPKKILIDNGREFVNKKMEAFCKENEIKMAHGSPRTPTTQGLVERSNRSWKEDMPTLILITSSQNLKKWCQKAQEAAYTGNIGYYRAIKMTPYEAVYDIKSHREVYTSQNSEANQEDPDLRVDDDLKKREDEEERPEKRRKISQNQEKYNHQMIEQTNKKNEATNQKFKVGDFVSIKIDRVDKTSPLHSNLLLGKIEEVVNSYVRVVTKYGRINTLILPTRLYPCTASTQNIELDYTSELSFSAACKKAIWSIYDLYFC